MKKTLTEFYGDLVRKHDWQHLAPLLDSLPAIEVEIGSRGLNTFTSHEVLRITPHTECSEWTQDDILSIVPDRSGVARVIFQTRADQKKMSIVDLFEKGGSATPYQDLISTILPYLDVLAQKKKN